MSAAERTLLSVSEHRGRFTRSPSSLGVGCVEAYCSHCTRGCVDRGPRVRGEERRRERRAIGLVRHVWLLRYWGLVLLFVVINLGSALASELILGGSDAFDRCSIARSYR